MTKWLAPTTATVLAMVALACDGGREATQREAQAAPPATQQAPAPTMVADARTTNAPSTPPAAPPAAAVPEPEGEMGKALRLQVLLDRAGYSPGEIDGKMGSNVKRALAQYEKNAGATAEQLTADTAPSLVNYTLTAEDVAGPFVDVPEDMMEKAKLDKLGYRNVQEALGERFHASPALLEQLNPGKAFTAGTQIVVPNVSDVSVQGRAAKVVVDKSDFSVNAVDESGRVLASYPATMGSSHDPLPIGTWKINGVQRDPVFNYNPDLFWDAEEGHGKAMLKPGPNNPVGVVWIDLSKEHYGIHGTPEPSTIGKTQSHGCIRLTNWDAAELAGLVAPGLTAELQR